MLEVYCNTVKILNNNKEIGSKTVLIEVMQIEVLLEKIPRPNDKTIFHTTLVNHGKARENVSIQYLFDKMPSVTYTNSLNNMISIKNNGLEYYLDRMEENSIHHIYFCFQDDKGLKIRIFINGRYNQNFH